MGYNLYITRRNDILDRSDDSEITVQEWLDWIEADSELRLDPSLGEHIAVWSGPSQHEIPWLQWSDGSIETKNPDGPLIEKMKMIAEGLGATVRGDDGETYGNRETSGAANAAEMDASPGIVDRLRSFWSKLTAPGETVANSDSPFKVGDRVRDMFGDMNMATVTRVDLSAEYGMGRITVRYDDGRVIDHSAIAPGVELVSKEGEDRTTP